MKQSNSVMETIDTDLANQNGQTPLSFDKILKEIGEFGMYQVTNSVLTCIALIFATFALFNFVFSAAIPEHRYWLSQLLLIFVFILIYKYFLSAKN